MSPLATTLKELGVTTSEYAKMPPEDKKAARELSKELTVEPGETVPKGWIEV